MDGPLLEDKGVEWDLGSACESVKLDQGMIFFPIALPTGQSDELYI